MAAQQSRGEFPGSFSTASIDPLLGRNINFNWYDDRGSA